MLKNLIAGDGFNSLVKMRDGWMLYNKNDQYIGAAIAKYGESSQAELNLMQEGLPQGSYIIEVGANIGSHTLGLSKHIGSKGKIFAFEPQRIIFQTLCANMAINSCTNAHCFERAVSDKKEKLTLPEMDYSKNFNFGSVSMRTSAAGEPVDCVVLDEALKDIPRLDLIKVDAEGMEYQVIKGAKNLITKYKPVLYVENDRVKKSKALIELIQSMDYRLYWHITKLYNPDNYAKDTENIFMNTGSLMMLCFHKDAQVSLRGFSEITDSSEHPLKQQNKR